MSRALCSKLNLTTNSISLDQVVAESLGTETRFPALPLTVAVQPVLREFTPAFAEEPAYDVTNVQYTGVNVAEPLWTAYALTDALFWGRDNQAGNHARQAPCPDRVRKVQRERRSREDRRACRRHRQGPPRCPCP